MSTKTTFKRIALVAVAALGLGVLSVAPSSAGVANLSLTVANGTAANGKSDSSTAATITVAGMMDIGAADSITVTFIAKDISANTAAVARMSYLDTATGSSNGTLVSSSRGTYAAAVKWAASNGTSDSKTASAAPFVIFSGDPAYVGAKFGVQLESKTAQLTEAGVFTYTALVSAYAGATLISSTSADFTITIAALASASKTPSAATSFVRLYTTAPGVGSGAAGSDDDLRGDATAGTTAGTVYVGVRNASGTTNVAQDSVTATITGAGVLCDANNVCGTSLKINASAGDLQLTVKGNGTSGVGTINIATNAVTYSAKSVTFFTTAAKTITTTVRHPVLGIGANTDAIQVTATDTSGNAWTGSAYIVASSAADALIAGSTTPVLCTAWSAANGIRCSITGTAPGTAKFKVIDASTVAAATATSAEFSVTVSSKAAGSVKLAFDKATYAPFEKAKITVTVLDTDGNAMPAQNISSVFTSGGISTSVGFSQSSDTLTATNVVLQAASSSTSGAVAGSQVYYVYMPAASGDVTISATGSTGLALAGRVAVSATASVVNASVDAATDAANEATDAANAATDAALAAADAADAATAAAQDASDAVAALSATVAKLVASLKAQITSLTNLVIKIQKKVKA